MIYFTRTTQNVKTSVYQNKTNTVLIAFTITSQFLRLHANQTLGWCKVHNTQRTGGRTKMFVILLFCFKLLAFFLAARFYYVTQIVRNTANNRRTKPAKTLIVLGSGGHTAEMMAIVKKLNKANYSPRCYILANTDRTSATKVLDYEEPATSTSDYELFRINRSRHVGQSYLSSVFTTIYSIVEAIPMVAKLQPDLILCNGPGTCVPICLIAFVLKVVGILSARSKIVFVESFCRVKSISLSGKILIYFVDSFVVQWPELINFSPKVQYFGRLI